MRKWPDNTRRGGLFCLGGFQDRLGGHRLLLDASLYPPSGAIRAILSQKVATPILISVPVRPTKVRHHRPRGRRRRRSCWCSSTSPERHKRRISNEPGHAHELTFSCSCSRADLQLLSSASRTPSASPRCHTVPGRPSPGSRDPRPSPVNSRHDPIWPSSRDLRHDPMGPIGPKPS
jgi:hypothetical protein